MLSSRVVAFIGIGTAVFSSYGLTCRTWGVGGGGSSRVPRPYQGLHAFPLCNYQLVHSSSTAVHSSIALAYTSFVLSLHQVVVPFVSG